MYFNMMNNKRLKFLIFILLHTLYSSVGIGAATSYQPSIVNPLTESWRWKHFPELEGKGIRFIVEDANHKVWASSNEGILEYNGYDWQLHQKATHFKDQLAEQLFVSQEKVLYATTSKGIFKYSNEHWATFFDIPENLSFIFHQIKQLSDKSIIACSDWGVLHFSNNKTDFYSSPTKIEQLKDDFPDINWIPLPEEALTDKYDFLNISDVLEENQSLWFALTLDLEKGKLLKFDPSSIQNQQITDYETWSSGIDFPLGETQKLLLAQDKKVWVINSTPNKGLSIFDGQNWETIHLNQFFGGDEYMTDIVQSEDGTIWISSMARIFTYSDNQWQLYRAPQYPIPANRVILQKSQRDQLWVAGYKSKVLLLDFSLENRLTYSNLSFQCEIAPNEQWFLEKDNRIVYKNGKNWLSYDVKDGLMDMPVKLIHTSEGQIWAAGSHQGVAATALFKNGQWQRHLHRNLSWGIDYRSVFEASDGSLWFGGSVDAEKLDGFNSGLLHLTNPTETILNWERHPWMENGLYQANIYGIGESTDGKIWIGGSKLLYYDGISWKNLPDERLNQYVNIVTSTKDLLLVGSRYYGLFIYDGKSWKNYNTSSGLSGNTIISIDIVADDCIYVATENDICRFDGKSWTQNVFPEKLNLDFEGGSIYHTSQNAIWINHVPRIWKRRAYQQENQEVTPEEFFTTFYQPDITPPETSFNFFLETVSPDGNTLISWTGKDYFANTAAQKLTYSYRINDGEWSVFSKAQQHTFTSLSSGEHTLAVRARDLDFNIDKTPEVIQFKVLPPIWKQLWFILLIATFLTIYGIYEYRVISKKKKLEVLNARLQHKNMALKEGQHKIKKQNSEILNQQTQIIEQANKLELNNKDLEIRNKEVKTQKEQLEIMVTQIEALSKAKLSFFTNISHELRTPITLISGPINQLIEKEATLPETQKKQLLQIIANNANRLLKLINQLLEIRKIEKSNLAIQLKNVTLPIFFEKLINLFANLAIEKDIYLALNFASQDTVFAVDQDKLEKIVVNLLSNAFKNTSADGSIIIKIDQVSAQTAQLLPIHDQYLEIAVEDTGRGIAKENIKQIYDRFYASPNQQEYSSGIGLSYTYQLVKLMQGDIKVESEVGVGTTFKVHLPAIITPKGSTNITIPNTFKAALAEANYLMKLHEPNRQLVADEFSITKKKILVVEDHPDMQVYIATILAEKYEVRRAINGQEGLERAKKHAFDLIISDVMMPEMDGYTFCHQLKTNITTSHIPVILLTAKNLEEHRIEGFEKGADAYITKPFSPDLLLSRIENLLQQREQLKTSFNRDFKLQPKDIQLTSPDEILLQKIVEMMEENLEDSNFNINQMCKSLHLSHMHFIRKTKQLTGKKPIDLLKSFRLKRAKDLLSQNKLTISEIAYKVGYDLPNSFSRAFKKEFSISPTKFVDLVNDSSNEKEHTHISFS